MTCQQYCLFILTIVAGVLSPLRAQQTPNSWTLGAPMPTALQGPFTGVIGDKVYVVGGVTTSTVLNLNQIYDTTSNTWSMGAPMPTARWFGGSAVVNNILYVIGGRSSTNVSLNVVEAYDPSTNTWSTKAPMPIVNDNVYATVENNIIYMVGGYSQANQSRRNNVLSYNPATDTWTTLAPLKVGKSEPAIGLIGSTIIAAGGLANGGATTTDTEGYNAATNSWTTLAPLPSSRQAGCFGVIAGLLYFVGGTSSGTVNGQSLSILDAYNGATDSWTSGLPSLTNAVVSPGSATVGGRLFCFGGSNDSAVNDVVYNYVQIYQPPLSEPVISSGGVVSASAFGGFSSFSPGSWIEIYGGNLASDTRGWASSDFNGINAPASLDGTTVSVGGKSAFVEYVSPAQVDALVTSDTPTGLQQLTVATSAGTSAAYNVTVNALQPGLLAPASFNVNGIRYAVAILPDGSYALPAGAIANVNSRPAHPGETVTLYGVGFGPVAPTTPAGELAQQLTSLASSFQMSIGGTTVTMPYAGLAPGFTGLYQFDAMVPAVAAGNAALTFSLAETPGTQTLYIAVGN